MTSIGTAMPKRSAAKLPEAGTGSGAGSIGLSETTMHAP